MKTLAASFGSTLASAPGPIDAGVLQRGLVGGVALNAEMPGLACLLDAALVLFEHHDIGAAVLQRLGELDADAAIAADDDVIVEFVDFSLHAPCRPIIAAASSAS